MLRRRRFRRGATVVWTDQSLSSNLLSIGPGGQNQQIALLPTGIVATKGIREQLTVQKILMWLNLTYYTQSGVTATLQDVSLGVTRFAASDTGIPGQSFGIFENPIAPGSMVNYSTELGSGPRDYMWRCKYFASSIPAFTSGIATGVTYNPQLSMASNAWLTGQVVQPWNPHVVIRSKRRLRLGEFLMFSMQTDQVLPANLSLQLKWAWVVYAK